MISLKPYLKWTHATESHIVWGCWIHKGCYQGQQDPEKLSMRFEATAIVEWFMLRDKCRGCQPCPDQQQDPMVMDITIPHGPRPAGAPHHHHHEPAGAPHPHHHHHRGPAGAPHGHPYPHRAHAPGNMLPKMPLPVGPKPGRPMMGRRLN